MTAAPLRRYGSFSLGDLRLALPMAALREVQPLITLIALPCAAPSVIGGLDLRGVIVPVLDLRRLLAHDCPPLGQPCVVVMVHQGRVLGLLADGVQAIFEASDQALSPIRLSTGVSVLQASLQAGPQGPLVSLLDAAALATLPDVPLADDPEPERQQDTDALAPPPDHSPEHSPDHPADPVPNDPHTRGAQTGTRHEGSALLDASLPMLLARSGRQQLAIDAMAVQATVSNPVLQPSVMARGHCRGVIDYAGLKVPAVDLSALCGLGPLADDQPWQALVLRLAEGLVACLVEQVLDVVRCEPQDLVSVPRFALPHPRLFRGALPIASLSAELVDRAGLSAPQFLVLDAEGLRQDPELQALASTNTGLGAETSPGSSSAPDGLRSMITYAVAGETASPLEQVCEILPFSAQTVIYESRGPLLGLAQHGGKAIPIVCLSRLAGLGPVTASPASSVLVVHCGEQQVGFAVPALKSIEVAEWEPALPCAERSDDLLRQTLAERPLALVGRGESQRMLRVLDLARLAQALCQADQLGTAALAAS